MSANHSPVTMRCPNCGAEIQLSDRLLEPSLRRLRLQAKKELEAELRPALNTAALISARSEVAEELRLRQDEVSKLRRELGALSKKGEPAQRLGVAREAILSELLQNRFPHDEIRRIRPGKQGADILQIVRGGTGQQCGSILWESKRATRWSKSWVTKLLADQQREHSDIAILVSDVLPLSVAKFGTLDGVLAATPDVAGDLAAILRQYLIALSDVQAVRVQRDDLKGAVYDYIHGEFVGHYRAIIEISITLRKNLGDERQQLTSRWQEREMQIQTLIEHLARIHGDFRGLGAALPSIDPLELTPAHTNACATSLQHMSAPLALADDMDRPRADSLR